MSGLPRCATKRDLVTFFEEGGVCGRGGVVGVRMGTKGTAGVEFDSATDAAQATYFAGLPTSRLLGHALTVLPDASKCAGSRRASLAPVAPTSPGVLDGGHEW